MNRKPLWMALVTDTLSPTDTTSTTSDSKLGPVRTLRLAVTYLVSTTFSGGFGAGFGAGFATALGLGLAVALAGLGLALVALRVGLGFAVGVGLAVRRGFCSRMVDGLSTAASGWLAAGAGYAVWGSLPGQVAAATAKPSTPTMTEGTATRDTRTSHDGCSALRGRG